MRICHLSSVHPLRDTRILYKECAGLAENGHDVHLIIRHDRDETIAGVHVHGIPHAPFGRIGRILMTTRAVMKKARSLSPDVCHIHDIELIPAALLLKKLYNISVVYDVHEDNPETVMSRKMLPSLLRKPVAETVRLIEKLSAASFDAVVTVTPTINRRFRRYTSRVHMVRNFPAIDEARDMPSWNDRRDAVVYAGVIAGYRGIDIMLDAYETVRENRPVEFYLAGRFSSLERERKIRERPVFRHVDFRGFLPREETDVLMQKAKIGLVVLPPDPRYMVAYPTKLFEYMAAECAVIASDFPVWREIIDNAACGILVDPLDPNAIAEAIVYILDNPGIGEEMGKRGHEAALRQYRWQSELATLMSVYDNIDVTKNVNS